MWFIIFYHKVYKTKYIKYKESLKITYNPQFPGIILVNILALSKLCFSLVKFSHSVVSNSLQPINCSMPGLPVHHQFLESTQTHVHWVSDAFQSSHPCCCHLLLPSIFSQHQGLFKWVSSSHQVAKVLEFQLQYQSFQWTPRTDLL